MPELIESVAQLTELRNRDWLEITLASVMFDLLRPVRLTLWRVIAHEGSLRLQQRAGLKAGNRVAISDSRVAAEDLPLLDGHIALRACYDSAAPLRLNPDEHGLRAHVFAVSNEREVIGLLEIDQPAPLTEAQERLVCGLLRVYRNHLAVLDYSEHDELTGLLNRKPFDEAFDRMLAREPLPRPVEHEIEWIGHRRPGNADQHNWLAVIDIDFFKRVNDRYGHLHGDEVLLLLARLMRSTFRESDRLFRLGGEEFAVLLGRTEACYVEQVLERFRAAVESFDFPQIGRVTVSIGYTAARASDSASAAFDRADEALYIAKQSGRNQLRCYETLIAEGMLESNVHPVRYAE